MKSFSYNQTVADGFVIPASSFFYQDVATPTATSAKVAKRPANSADRDMESPTAQGPSATEVAALLSNARVEASTETESRLRREFQARSEAEAARISHALEMFQIERKAYFSRIESEVVHLALAISAKILHREAQVDPLLVSTLVRVAVEKLHDGSTVSVRVPVEQAEKWRERLANPHNGSTVAIVEDAHLGLDDCILETDVGSANFSIDAQLKEVEQGFFDLLAQRPPVK